MSKNSVYIAILLLLPAFVILFSERDTISKISTDKKFVFSTPTPSPTIHIIDMRMVKANEDKLFEAVENYRVSIGKPRQALNSIICEFAAERAQLKNMDNHAGFLEKAQLYLSKSGFFQVQENMTMQDGYAENPESYILNLWLGSPGHRKTLEDNYTHSCLKCGKDVCSQIFAR